MIGFFAVLGLTGRPLHVPVWMVAEAESRINKSLEGGLAPGVRVAVGGVILRVDRDWTPRLALDDLRLLTLEGKTIASLPEARVTFDARALLSGELRPSRLLVVGAQIRLVRLEDGRLDLAFGTETAGAPAGTLAEILDQTEAAFQAPILSRLDRIEAEGLSLTLDDRRARRVWQVGDGRITLENRPEELALQVSLGLVGGATDPARADLTIVSVKPTHAARLTANVADVAAADIAAQSNALAWLGVLDAPISGGIQAALDDEGRMSVIDASLVIAAGALHPSPAAKPVPFHKAGLKVHLDVPSETFTFSDLTIDSQTLRLTASGVSRLPGLARGLPTSYVSQVSFSDLQLDPEGLFQAPVRFSAGQADFRLTLDPFTLQMGQFALQEGDTRLVARGTVRAGSEGWNVSADLGMNQISADKVMGLWPLALTPKTRDWVKDNLQEGTLFNVRAGLRLVPRAEPVLTFDYEFAGAEVRFMRTMPPVRGGYGYSSISGKTYTTVLERGAVEAAKGGAIDMAGSVFKVLDITRKPATAQVTLKTDSSVTAALSILDEPPFRFLSKAGQAVDLAEGRAQVDATLTFPLKPKIEMPDVDFQVRGRLSGVRSDRLVEGHVLAAEMLQVSANRDGLTISGPGYLGQAPFDGQWHLDFAPAKKGTSRVTGTAQLSDTALHEFGVTLPEGMVSGLGTADMQIDLVKGEGGRFRITSDLAGIGLSLPAIGLAKPRDATGQLEVEGHLGKPAGVDRLVLQSGPVRAEGSVTTRAEGGLDLARFSKVTSGNWLDVSADLRGQGQGKPVAIAITGGTLDLRRIPDMAAGSGEGGPDIDVQLDRITATESLSLTSFAGSVNGRGGLNGDFAARLNGKAAVVGAIAPTTKGTALRVRSDDAGAVIAAAGIFEKAKGGTLDLTLTPTGGKAAYRGTAEFRDVQITEAPVLAALLNAVSVVGLLEQLRASGLFFSSGQAEFQTSPAGVEILQSSAIGASLGVSLSGRFDAESHSLDLAGVISPIYMLNGIGSILTRPGEGLFGFNYTVRGPTSAPRVSVNPLSILTPGMFREIFRAPPPKAGG